MNAVFDHAGVESTCIDDEVRLYVERLGLDHSRWGIHRPTGGRIAMLTDAHGVKVELIEVAAPTGRWAHIAFRTGDIAAAHAGAVDAGCISETEELWIEAARADTSLVRTPSGNLVQFIKYQPDSPDMVATMGVAT